MPNRASLKSCNFFKKKIEKSDEKYKKFSFVFKNSYNRDLFSLNHKTTLTFHMASHMVLSMKFKGRSALSIRHITLITSECLYHSYSISDDLHVDSLFHWYTPPRSIKVSCLKSVDCNNVCTSSTSNTDRDSLYSSPLLRNRRYSSSMMYELFISSFDSGTKQWRCRCLAQKSANSSSLIRNSEQSRIAVSPTFSVSTCNT